MSFKSTALAAIAAASFALPAFAADIMINDPYARSSAMMSTSGAAFMQIMNHGSTDDRLIGAASPVAKLVELHTHKEDENGVMRMIHVEQGDTVPLTLTFEQAGDITVEVPVDLERMPSHGMGHQHGKSE